MTDEEYITAEQAAEILRVSSRQAHRYGEGDDARIRTRRAGRRIMFHKGDVEDLARDLDVAHKPLPRPPAMRIMPTGEVLDYLKVRDEQLEALRQELNQAYQRIGQLEGVLQTRLLPDQEQELRQRLLEVEQARIALEEEVQQRAKPWWKRLFS